MSPEELKLNRQRIAVEARLKRADQQLARQQFEFQKTQGSPAGWRALVTPTGGVLVAATLALIGTAVGKWTDNTIEQKKQQTSIILKASEVTPTLTAEEQEIQRARNLLWFAGAGFLSFRAADLERLTNAAALEKGQAVPPPVIQSSAVGEISSRLIFASSDWNDLVRDLLGSCERERAINPMLTNCERERKVSNGIIAANEVLRDYFKALNAAATETNFTVQPGLDKVIESVAAIPNIDKAQLTAVSGLVGLLAKLSVEKMRADTLGVLIGEGDAAAQSIIGFFGQAVPLLRSRVESEKTQLTGYFVVAILRQRDPVGSDPEALCSGSAASKFSGTGLLLAREYCNQVASLGNKLKLLDKYETSLKAASKALTELQSSKSDLTAKALAQKLYAIGSELEPGAARRNAFGMREINSSR